MAWGGPPPPAEDTSARPEHGPLEASAPEYVPQHTTVAMNDWEEPGELDPSGQTRRKARYLPPSPRGPGYTPPLFGQAAPGSPVSYPKVYGATADVAVAKQPSKEEAAFEEGSDIPPGNGCHLPDLLVAQSRQLANRSSCWPLHACVQLPAAHCGAK